MPDITKVGEFGHIPIKQYTKPNIAGLKSTIMGTLEAEKKYGLLSLHFRIVLACVVSCKLLYMETNLSNNCIDIH